MAPDEAKHTGACPLSMNLDEDALRVAVESLTNELATNAKANRDKWERQV